MKFNNKPARWLAAAIAATACSMAFAGPVSREFGPNLITNGSFENTTTVAGSGWLLSGLFATGLEGVDYLIDTASADAEQGTRSFAGGAVGGLGFISQDLVTVPGVDYNIHIWLANLSGFADNTAISVLWGGNLVYSATEILGFSYREIVIDPLASSTLTRLSIGLQDDSFYLNVDNVSVRAVPEPATLALLAGGLMVGGLARRRSP